MRIAFCVVKHIARGGGIEKYTYELGRRLAARGHQVTVYSTRRYGPVDPVVEGMRVVSVPSLPRGGEKLSASAWSAARTLVDGREDVVHFHHVSAGWAAGVVRAGGTRCLLQVHSVAERSPQWGASGSTVLRVLEGLAVRSCDALTAISPAVAGHLLRRYGRDAAIIPPGVDSPASAGTAAPSSSPPAPSAAFAASSLPPAETSRSRPTAELARWGLASGSYVLYAGRLSPEKGPDILIRAFRRLSTHQVLVIAGESRDPAYRARLAALAEGDPRIRFTGWLSGEALADLYAHARLFVLPSLLEGLSLALLEAMSCGLPCLASDIPENRHVLAGTGFTFPSGDAAALADRMNSLLADPDACRAAGLRAQALVRARYSWDSVADAYESLYQRLARRQAA